MPAPSKATARWRKARPSSSTSPRVRRAPRPPTCDRSSPSSRTAGASTWRSPGGWRDGSRVGRVAPRKEAAMAPLLQSATTPSDGHAIVTVRGDIDTDTALQLWQYLSYLIGQGHHLIVLDLRGMILIDSAGVEVLARVSAWTRRKGGELVLRSASPALAEQLELARRAEAHRRHPSAGGR